MWRSVFVKRYRKILVTLLILSCVRAAGFLGCGYIKCCETCAPPPPGRWVRQRPTGILQFWGSAFQLQDGDPTRFQGNMLLLQRPTPILRRLSFARSFRGSADTADPGGALWEILINIRQSGMNVLLEKNIVCIGWARIPKFRSVEFRIQNKTHIKQNWEHGHC